MKEPLDIQFISDVMCPWCVVGLGNLNQALEQLSDTVDATVTFQPFELNPKMPLEGQNLDEHITEKYGINKAQSEQNRAMIQARGKEIDFDFNFTTESRMRNSFDAHRLLHWAQLEGKQAELKSALFKAHFTHNQDISDHTILANLAASVNLDPAAAKGILENNHFADDVRQQEKIWQQNGITSVPTVIINNAYAISGGQPAEVFKSAIEEVLEKLKTEQAPA
ncbi:MULTISPECIES: DsbA family oxidoreductase [Marinomonas]|uniref:DsbA family oxidoreductase n=1 Tax=Marinomonas arctica TaxID=383750 RepID=A0A7H1J7N8_9GAMM|nr:MULTISPECIES: DsbA family oxidoreductase [Marinomonas]MCS7487491.1 DSBA oxidoreductase [Marinomonas sp. BSi20414]QNT06504.1 DsbA family oxidoreductase [Marinomonas arctica]GGN35601.1 2-hydroxychromene-2-carboxylate isomerase [Marinomonas arctica]